MANEHTYRRYPVPQFANTYNRPERHYYDDFLTVGTRWNIRAGTFTGGAGGLRAATIVDWGANQVANPEFTTDNSIWVPTNGAISRVDSSGDPGDDSTGHGAADKWVGKIVTDVGTNGYVTQSLGRVIGALYHNDVIAFAPSGNATVTAALLFVGANNDVINNEDVWEALIVNALAAATPENWQVYNWGGANGDIAYFDACKSYRQNAVLTLDYWGSPDGEFIYGIKNPAALTTPFGIVFRYTDSLNYWECRMLPNTAGNDIQIYEVVAGVETARGTPADIDWTAGQIDYVKVTLRGAAVTITRKKFGATAYSAGTSYATMTTGLTKCNHGAMLYEAAVDRWITIEMHQ